MFHYAHIRHLQKPPGMKEEDEPEEEEEEELGHAETYAEYMPMKRKCDLFHSVRFRCYIFFHFKESIVCIS